MKLPDANVLIYAVNADAPRHETSRSWLDAALSGADTVAFSWIALLAFVRLTTEVGLFPNPLDVPEAMDRVEAWLGSAAAVIVEPTREHPQIVRRLLAEIGAGGTLVNDAHLAALALEHRGTVVSFDHGFRRFGGVAWEQPAPPER